MHPGEGLQELARQPADGYTVMTMLQAITVGPSLYPQYKIDLLKDIQPVGQFTRYSNVLVHPWLHGWKPHSFMQYPFMYLDIDTAKRAAATK